MKPNKTIQNMSNHKLITLFEKEIISHSGQEYDELGNRVPMCSKNRLNMLRTEINIRLDNSIKSIETETMDSLIDNLDVIEPKEMRKVSEGDLSVRECISTIINFVNDLIFNFCNFFRKLW